MVDAVLEIMQKAVVPWSNVVEKLVQKYLKMEGPKYVYTDLTPMLFFLHKLKKNWFIIAVSISFFSNWYFPQTRAFEGELPADGDQKTSEGLWDPQLQSL